MIRNLRFLLAVLVALILIPVITQAQSTASVTGVLTDTSGAVVPGASIKLENTRTGASYFGKTAGDGSYRIVDLPPGPGYTLTFKKDGFQTFVVNNLYLPVATATTQDARLELGSLDQTIQVTAQGSVSLNTTDASIGNVIDAKTVQNLPSLFRDDATALLRLQPGVQITGGDSQNGSVTGSRADQGNVTLDGLDVNDETIGTPFAAVGRAPIDSVSEVRTIVGNQDVTYGRSGGAQVDLVTKSGTNQWHGSVSEFNRVSAMAANNFFNKLNGVPRGQLTRNQFGGSLGGPILKDKLFVFFDYEGRQDRRSTLVTLAVPLPAFRAGQLSYVNDTGGISTLPAFGLPGSQTVQGLDPQDVGPNQAFLTFVNSRYPAATNSSAGDGINTGGFSFNSPVQLREHTFVGRIDYAPSSKHALFARGTWDRDNATQVPALFPGDQGDQASFIGHERSWVVGDTWTISPNLTNQASFGLTRQVDAFPINSFPTNFDPLNPTNFIFGVLSDPFGDIRQQSRNVPVPELRDTLAWTKGSHTMQFGGDFKWIRVHSSLTNDINFQVIGLSSNITSLDSTLRPADILDDPSAQTLWDDAFTTILGRYANTTAQYNYDVAGTPVPQFTPSVRNFHYNEYELFAQDTWKIRKDLTLTYGLRWNYHGVPFEANGLESVPTLFAKELLNARLQAAASGINGDDAAPFVSYTLGGPKNHGPGYYKPDYKDFGPRLGIAYSPSFTDGFWGRLFGDRKTSVRAGAGIVYDRLLSTLQFEVDETGQLFDSSMSLPYGIQFDPQDSLLTDPRFTSLSTPPALPSPGTIPRPTVTPFVSGGVGTGLFFNNDLFQLNNTLKSPYSIMVSFGFQRELPGNFVLDANYFGRFGRRLIAVGDPAQQLNFKDPTSGQFLNTAFGNVQQELQAGTAPNAVTQQDWFENQINAQIEPFGIDCPFVGLLFGLPDSVSNCTQLAADALPGLFFIGDLSSTDLVLTNAGLLAPNTGLFSQTGSVASVGNFSASSYNGFVFSLRKRLSNNLQFDFDYAYAHSIDNVSDVTNDFIFSSFNSQGLICDLLNRRTCRGSSDFDATHTISVNYEYELPIGRGQRFLHDSSKWLDVLAGGWVTSGIISYHSGFPWNTITNAFPINFTQQAPAVFVGPKSAVKQRIHVDDNGSLQLFDDPVAAANAFTFPFGGGTGDRNVLRGPGFANVDIAILKNFKMPWSDSHRLQFRAEAFNLFNHPNFNNPSVDPSITTGTSNTTNNNIQNGLQYGVLTNTANSARQWQLALRYEF